MNPRSTGSTLPFDPLEFLDLSEEVREIIRRGEELDKITPALVPHPDGLGWIGSSDPRWLALYRDARALEEAEKPAPAA